MGAGLELVTPAARRELAERTIAALERAADGLALLDLEAEAAGRAMGFPGGEGAWLFGFGQDARRARAAAANLRAALEVVGEAAA